MLASFYTEAAHVRLTTSTKAVGKHPFLVFIHCRIRTAKCTATSNKTTCWSSETQAFTVNKLSLDNNDQQQLVLHKQARFLHLLGPQRSFTRHQQPEIGMKAKTGYVSAVHVSSKVDNLIYIYHRYISTVQYITSYIYCIYHIFELRNSCLLHLIPPQLVIEEK